MMCRRGEIDLCARLLGIAAAGLNENPGLLGFVVVAKFTLLSVMLPLLAFSGLAYTNGDLAPNSKSRSGRHPFCASLGAVTAVNVYV